MSLKEQLNKCHSGIAWIICQCLLHCCCCWSPVANAAVGYSYARFAGPVRGPEHKILVHDALSGAPRVDFVAQPEYAFAYGIEDGARRVLQNRQETRSGNAVQGFYSLVDPDGMLRVVKYTADSINGFQAEVIRNGITTLHGHDEQRQEPVDEEFPAQLKDDGKWHEVHHHGGAVAIATGAADDDDDDDDDDNDNSDLTEINNNNGALKNVEKDEDADDYEDAVDVEDRFEDASMELDDDEYY